MSRLRSPRRWLQKLPLYFMMVPGAAYLLVNNILPLFGITIAFKNINFSKGLLYGILNGDWAGFSHFEYLFKTKDAWIITRNTIGYNLVFIAINTAAGFLLAVLLRDVRSKAASALFQMILLFPCFISWVAVSYLVTGFLSTESGILNTTILPALGLSPVSWYSTPKAWPYILIIVNTWKNAGLQCVVYYSAMQAVAPEAYEAAALDGASRVQTALKITLPMIAPVVVTMALLSVGKIMYSDFGLFYQVPLDTGILYDMTNTIDTYVYRALTRLGNVSMSAAAGLYQSLVGFVLILLSNAAVRKIDADSAMF